MNLDLAARQVDDSGVLSQRLAALFYRLLQPGRRRRDSQLRLYTRFRTDEAVGDTRTGAVVFGLDHATQHVGVELHVAAAPHGPHLVQLAGVQELIQPLRPAPGAPQILLVLASDEAFEVEAQPNVAAGAKAKRLKRDAELRGPPVPIPASRDVPNAVPILIEIVEVAELRVPAGAVGVGPEDECPAPVVKAVDQKQHMIIAGQVSVPAELRGADSRGCAVVGLHADVQRDGVSQHFHDGALSCGLPGGRLALAQIGD